MAKETVESRLQDVSRWRQIDCLLLFFISSNFKWSYLEASCLV